MHSALLTTVLALAAPLVSAATLPREIMEVEARDTTVPGKSRLHLRKASRAMTKLTLRIVSYATAYLDISLKIADFGCSAAPNSSVVKNVRARPSRAE